MDDLAETRGYTEINADCNFTSCMFFSIVSGQNVAHLYCSSRSAVVPVPLVRFLEISSCEIRLNPSL